MKKLLLILLCLPMIGFGQCTYTTTNETFPGACDGSILITSVSGCTAPYTYTWSNGTTNPPGGGLCAGTYIIDIIDVNGINCCNIIVTINVMASISGCTDSLALNYDPTATIDDSSCIY